MPLHESDNLEFVFGPDGEIYIHRRDPDDKAVIKQTTKLERHEANFLLDALLEDSGFRDRAAENLCKKEIVRPNHSIGSIIP